MTTANNHPNNNDNDNKLDFRDIRVHPPAAAELFTPLPLEHGWDAHRVYFNERPRPTVVHGDDFDAVFAHEPPVLALEAGMVGNNGKQQAQADDDFVLDPLGWPVVPPGFRSHAQPTTTLTLSLSADDDDEDDDDADNDDLNLLRHTSSYDNDDDDEALLLVAADDAAHATAHDISGIEVAHAPSAAAAARLVGYRVPEVKTTKAARIVQYGTTGVDDESRVEEEDEDSSVEEEEDGGHEVRYHAKEDEEEDDDDAWETPIANFASFDTECHPVQQQMAQLHVGAASSAVVGLSTFTVPPPPPNNNKKKSTAVPLLRPPPPEKMAAWEAARKK